MQPCPCYRAVLERCSSGLRGTPGKRVYSKRVSGVRISFSPQTEKENQRQVHLNADFLFPVCTAPPQAAGDVGTTADEISERRRRTGPPTGDVGATANEISERRRLAAPPTQKFVRRKRVFSGQVIQNEQVVRRKGRFSGQIRISNTRAYTSRTIFSTTSFAP